MTAPTPDIPLNADGSPNFGTLEPTLVGVGGSSTPTPAGSDSPTELLPGMAGYVNIWNLPTTVLDYEQYATQKPFWLTSTTSESTTPGRYEASPQSLKFMEVNGLPLPAPGSAKVGSTSPSTTTSTANLKMLTADQIMAQYAAMSQTDPTGYQALQKQLYQAGFYGNISTPPPTAWSDETATAIGKAMVAYIQVSQGAGVPVTFPDFLKNSVSSNTAGGGLGSGYPGASSAAPPSLEDPATLAMYAQKAAQAALGRNLSPEQVNQFVAQYHNEQQQAAAGKTAGDQVNTADPRAEAINFVTSNNQGAFAQNQIQGYTDAFLNMFESGQSAAPNVNTDPTAVGF